MVGADAGSHAPAAGTDELVPQFTDEPALAEESVAAVTSTVAEAPALADGWEAPWSGAAAEPVLPTWPEPPAMPSVLHEWSGPGWPDELDIATMPTVRNGVARDELAPAEHAPAEHAPAEHAPAGPVATAGATAPAVDAAAAGLAAPAEPYVPAGAYMPPSAVFAPEPAPAEPPKPRPGDAPLLADLPFDAPDDLPGWLVASGAAIGTVGFFLPWAHRLIAASGEGYFNAWGLGALMHLPVFVAALVTLGLAVRPNRVPGWLRAGVLPLVLGGLLLGLAWPYVFVGPLRGQFGSVLEAFAGLVLVVGGILALRTARHSGGPPRV
jgi:hypothetical protein